MVRADGSLVWVLIDMTVVRDANDEPSYYFVQVRDLTDRKRAEEALEHQALHDDLTRLPNRLLLVDRLSHSLARAERTGTSLAVLFLDLDRFKLVNDGLGHVVGDQLLIEVAERLGHAVRGSDTVARFGGDEFVIVREDVEDVSEAIEFAERVAATLHEPIALSGRELYATTSIGIAIGGEGASAEQLLRDADAAMYRAKDLGRARIELFSHELQQRVAARLDLETALRQAIERDELQLLYQPIVRLADGRVVGAEALLRWHREGNGVILPADFIPVAEETGLIVPIGTWALEHALTEMRALTRNHDSAEWPLLAVNLSALQLRLPTSIAMVRDAIDASGVDPSMLSLEITESALMDDIELSARAMHALRDLGVRLAVDDFGTGYSSLAYLKRLPVDSLKIDRSFIDGLPSDPHDRSITEAIVTLGNSLGLTIVAEGVETVEQWIALDELGCTVGQGFLWSPPIPASAFAPLITGLRRPARVARSTPGRTADAN
jgi:diguanylate cyclase (GGDEF)-like protein